MARADIPFATDDAHRFLPWIIGIMACLATLLLCLSLTAGSWIIDRSDSYSNSFTVNIPTLPNDKNAKVRDLLQKLPGVDSVSQVSQDKLKDMLKPWLGSEDAMENLPLPTVFEVSLNGKTDIDFKELQNKLNSIAPGGEIDSHQRWIASFSQFSAAMQGLITVLAVLIIGGLALIVAFTSRASLKLHARTVQLLHSIGAEDSYIAQQFQREAIRLTLFGTLPGALIAGLAYKAAGLYLASLPSSALPSLAMGVLHIGLLLLMPMLCGGVAWVAARMAVRKQLQQVL